MSTADSSRADDDARLQVLQGLAVLDSAPEAGFDALVDCAAALTGCPIALLSLTDSRRQWFKARRGLDVPEIPREIAFCDHAIRQPLLLEVPDARADRRFAGNPMVTQEPHLRFYAGMPLEFDGVRLGTLCVLDTEPRALSSDQRAGLEGLARAATELLHQRRSRLALQEQSLRLHDLARASGDWMWELDAELRYRWISGEYEAITGLPAAARLGQRVSDEVRIDARGAALQQHGGLLALLERRVPFARAITVKPTPRGTLYVSRSAMPVFDADGRFAGWRGTSRDVTAQIQAEREAQLKHELLRKLSSQVPGVIFQYHVNTEGLGRYLYASEGVREMFGVEPPGVDGGVTDSSVPFRLLHADDRDGFQDSIGRAVRELSAWTREYRIVREDGSVRWLDSRAVPERLADGSTLFHGFTADITERKQTELALRETETRWERAADAAGIGLVELDVASGRLRLDRRACTVHGLPYPHPPIGLDDWMALVHDEDRPQVRAGLAQSLRPSGRAGGRMRIVRADGGLRHIELAVDARDDGQGGVATLIGSCRDVSEQIANERLKRDKDAAERANQAKSEFLSRVSHELRTPLNSILGFAQLMALDKHHPLAPEQQRRLGGVQRASRHLLDLIDEVLDLTRIERDDFELPLAPVDLCAVIADCLRVVHPLAAERGIALPAPPRGSCWVQAEPRALEQVMLNLLSNAIKYNRAGAPVELQLSTDASQVQLAVVDHGEGMNARQQAQLFQPFNRLGAERRRIEGTGLGLVIARELVLAMEGRLEVRSAPGAGSRFTVVLWAADAAPAATETAEPTVPAPLHEPAAAATRCVLYIEDEPVNAILMQEMFRSFPAWTLHVAEDGARGLAQARALRPHLLLVDMNLPDMNGLQIIRRLRADPATAGLRCVAFSADAMREQIAAARAAGFDDYWTKPIDLKRMLELLGQALA